MTDADIMLYIGLFACAIGLSWTSYKIGFREGTGRMIDFVKSKSNKQGYTLMHFHNDEIQFMDALEYNRLILEALGAKDEQSS